jgi:hypothetical protein
MFLPEPTRENPYERGAPVAPLAAPAGGGSAEGPSRVGVGLDLAEHEVPFAWPEGTREVDALGRDVVVVAKGRLEGRDRQHREKQLASWRHGRRRHFGEGMLIGGLQLGACSAVVHMPWSWGQQPVLVLAGALAMGLASARTWGTLETALTWVGFGTWVADGALQSLFAVLLGPAVIATSKLFAQAFEDPLR